MEPYPPESCGRALERPVLPRTPEGSYPTQLKQISPAAPAPPRKQEKRQGSLWPRLLQAHEISKLLTSSIDPPKSTWPNSSDALQAQQTLAIFGVTGKRAVAAKCAARRRHLPLQKQIDLLAPPETLLGEPGSAPSNATEAIREAESYLVSGWPRFIEAEYYAQRGQYSEATGRIAMVRRPYLTNVLIPRPPRFSQRKPRHWSSAWHSHMF